MDIFAFMFGTPWWQDLETLAVSAIFLWMAHRQLKQMRSDFEARVNCPGEDSDSAPDPP
jgi:hypothetical protein